MIQESHFSVHEVESFLCNIGLRFAQTCWHNDMIVDGDSNRVSYTQTANWFKRFFPSNQNQYLFRLLEAHCTQLALQVMLVV
jgi:hypothetical protein